MDSFLYKPRTVNTEKETRHGRCLCLSTFQNDTFSSEFCLQFTYRSYTTLTAPYNMISLFTFFILAWHKFIFVALL